MASDSELKSCDCPAYIVAGGRSSRFGSDKACVRIAGRPLLQRLERQMESLGHDVHVVADQRDRYSDLGVDCLVDLIPGGGPAVALLTASEHRKQQYGPGWLLLLACDQVCWDAEWFEALAEGCIPDLAAVTFTARRSEAEKSSFFQPLPGLYQTSFAEKLWAEVRAARTRRADSVLRIESGSEPPRTSSLQSLLEQNSCLGIPADNNPSDWSFNTPEELEAVLVRMRT